MTRRFGRRATWILLMALVATGCTRTVAIPIAELEGAAPEHKGRYRIWTTDGSRYITRGFSVSDSTIVIKNLDSYDDRYRVVELPVTLVLRDVKTIEKFESRGLGVNLLVLTACAAVVWTLVIFRSSGEGPRIDT